MQSCPHGPGIAINHLVQGLNFCLRFRMHMTVHFVGRNVVLLLTNGDHLFVFMMCFNNSLKEEQQAPDQYSHSNLTMTESCLIEQRILIPWLCKSFKVSWDLFASASGLLIEF